MTDDLRARADARLESALATASVRDPRPFLRPILKHLKERDAPAFDRAISHFESALVPSVAGDGDPLAEWLEYGRVVTGLAGDGRVVAIDGTGRATPLEPGGEALVNAGGEAWPDALVVWLPEAADTPPVVLRCPADAAPAQEATIELLVLGRASVSDQLSAVSSEAEAKGRERGLSAER